MDEYINKIIHADCLDYMKTLPDNSIDLVLCDLPYGTTACSWDVVIDFDLLWQQYKRIAKDHTTFILFGSQPFTTDLIMSNRKWFKYELVLEKSQSVGFVNAYKMPLKKHENIIIFCKKSTIYNYQLIGKPIKDIRPHSKSGHTDVYDKNSKRNTDQSKNRKIPLNKKLPETIIKINNVQKTIHPTQKPVDLFEYLIKTYSNENMIVLDNCSGSGTTAIAALRTNRRFICIEKDKEYYEASLKRLKHEKSMRSGEHFFYDK